MYVVLSHTHTLSIWSVYRSTCVLFREIYSGFSLGRVEGTHNSVTRITFPGYSDSLRVSGLPRIFVIDGVAHFPFQGWACFSSCWECCQQIACNDQPFQGWPQLWTATLPKSNCLQQPTSNGWLRQRQWSPSLSAQSRRILMGHFGSRAAKAVDQHALSLNSCSVQSYLRPLLSPRVYHKGIP